MPNLVMFKRSKAITRNRVPPPCFVLSVRRQHRQPRCSSGAGAIRMSQTLHYAVCRGFEAAQCSPASPLHLGRGGAAGDLYEADFWESETAALRLLSA